MTVSKNTEKRTLAPWTQWPKGVATSTGQWGLAAAHLDVAVQEARTGQKRTLFVCIELPKVPRQRFITVSPGSRCKN